MWEASYADDLGPAGARSQATDGAEAGPSPSQEAGSGAATPAAPVEDQQSLYTQQLSAVPEFEEYGQVLKSSTKPVELTESETEYVVTCVKHVFKEHVVFQVRCCRFVLSSCAMDVVLLIFCDTQQFNVRNTLPDTVLEQVSVLMSPASDVDLSEDFIIPIQQLTTGASGAVYVSFTRASAEELPLGSFSNTLKFVSKEVDPSSGEPEEEGYEDEYQLEDMDLGASDYIIPSYATFATEWDRLRSGASLTETFSLSALGSLQGALIDHSLSRTRYCNSFAVRFVSTEACTTLIDILGMEPLGGTEAPTSSSVHALNLSGIVCGGAGKVLARARMTYAAGQGVTLELAARAEQDVGARLVLSAIA